jgi:hypothetical protein
MNKEDEMDEVKLQHHGIKGMKWGVRRYQNKDGSLTPAGKKRYDIDGSTNKSKHRHRLEEKYRQRGMTPQEAETAASARIKTEKIIAGAGAMTVAAASAYVINKQVKERADGIIKAGTKIQRVTSDPKEDLNRAFYAAYKKPDLAKYKGLYGEQLGSVNAHNVSIEVTKDLKIASRQKAANAFADLYKNDPEFKEAFKKSNKRLYSHGVNRDLDAVVRRASGEMSDKQLKKVGYDAFNVGLANHDINGRAVAEKFYNKLKQQGYDAVIDINDKRYSGYDAKKPVIVFNKSNKAIVSEVNKMTTEQIVSNLKKVRAKEASKEVRKAGYVTAGSILAGQVGATTINKIAVNNYRIKHPSTKLSDREISEMLTKNRS